MDFLHLPFAVLFQLWAGQGPDTASIQGKVTDAKTNEVLLFATVVLYKSGVLIKGCETDLDGNFVLTRIMTSCFTIPTVGARLSSDLVM